MPDRAFPARQISPNVELNESTAVVIAIHIADKAVMTLRWIASTLGHISKETASQENNPESDRRATDSNSKAKAYATT